MHDAIERVEWARSNDGYYWKGKKVEEKKLHTACKTKRNEIFRTNAWCKQTRRENKSLDFSLLFAEQFP